MPRTAIQNIAVFLERFQARIGQMFENVDLRKGTYVEHAGRPSH
jgi:hypothetical protein